MDTLQLPPTLAVLRWRLILIVSTLLVVGWLANPGAAFADADAVVEGTTTFVVTKPVWTIVTGLVLPFLIALISKASASATFKGVLGIVLAAVAAIVERATLTDGSALFTSALLFDALMVYAPQLLTYLGVWQHVGLNDSKAMLPSKGLG